MIDFIHNQNAVSTEEEEMYKENILDHNKNPRNAGRLEVATFRHRELNTSCGDIMEMYVLMDDAGNLQDICFDGKGCAISIAAASLLTEQVKSMSVEAIRKMGKDDMIRLLGINVGATRITCALLALKTLQKGLEMNSEKL